MESWATIVANVLGFATFIGGLTFCVWFDQQGKTRRRELEHAERMRAIDLGRPLDDEAVARYQALGAVGVAVPAFSLSAAVMGTCFAPLFEDSAWRFAALAVLWVVCGAVCLAVLPVIVARLRESPHRSPARAEPIAAEADRGGEASG